MMNGDTETEFERERDEYLFWHGWRCETCGQGEDDCDGGDRCCRLVGNDVLCSGCAS